MRTGAMASAGLVGGLLLSATFAGVASAGETRPPKLSRENRYEIVRKLAYEYATARKPLPAGKLGVELNTQGEVDEAKLRQQLANHGAAVRTGEVLQITKVDFRSNRIIFEINGGGKTKKKKW